MFREQVLYVASQRPGKYGVATFHLSEKGELVPATPFFVKLSYEPHKLVLNNNNSHLLVYGENPADQNTISGFAIGPKGRLTNPYTPTRAMINGLVFVKHPSGHFGYRLWTGGIFQYRLAKNGSRTPLYPPKVLGSENARAIAVDPRGRAAYVDTEKGLREYRIQHDGTLVAFSPAASDKYGAFPLPTAHPLGQWVYVTSEGATAIVSVLPKGRLGKTNGFVSGAWYALRFDAIGKHAFDVVNLSPLPENPVEWSGPQPVIAKFSVLPNGQLRPAPSPYADYTKWGIFACDLLIAG